jgi:hypothetical protein
MFIKMETHGKFESVLILIQSLPLDVPMTLVVRTKLVIPLLFSDRKLTIFSRVKEAVCHGPRQQST